ncbi:MULTISPECIES: hypothetical protein [unclassified Pseudomonas]|uniref:hypothetical protein n=1 Tax=unclassified Pseudomonas TaxID=196821 RepID=UPI00200FCDBA|nr:MULTISPECIES: hypothetical protein [unclassified Pseudomonas]
MSKRDEFLSPVKRALAERSGFRCSYLGCSKATVGPSEESDIAVARTGVACHITAAAEGGKRFDKDMSEEVRASISNGIWMCSSHSVEIDRDAARYTVNVLQHWKEIAEAKADYAKTHGWKHFDNDSYFPVNNLADIDLSLDRTSNTNNLIGNSILDSCLPNIWGQKQSVITRDLLIELYRNAFKHGNATRYEMKISAKKIEVQYDGDEFNIFNLLSHEKADGGADTLTEIIEDYRDDIVVNYVFDGENRVTIHQVHDFSELAATLPCVIELNEYDDEKTVDSLSIHEKCGALYILLPMHFCRSDVNELSSSLSAIQPNGKPVFIVGSAVSDRTKKALIARFPSFTFIQK